MLAPAIEASDEMLRITPLSAARIGASTARVSRRAPVKLIAKT